MKLVLIVYNVAIEEEVMESLKEIGVENYTKWDRVLGKGKTSGTHLDTDVWPGVNHMLAIAVEDEKKDKIILTSSSGNINSISVIVDNELWEGSIGESLRNTLAAPVDGLPQEEPLFSLNQMPQQSFEGFVR
ncbi:hypothetical protein LCGC14_3157190, partial [marine sediment metagenome]